MKTVVFAGGGTGGHIYPGLAVADELKTLDPDVRVVWFGSSSGRDKEMVCSNKNERSLPSADSFVGIPSHDSTAIPKLPPSSNAKTVCSCDCKKTEKPAHRFAISCKTSSFSPDLQ